MKMMMMGPGMNIFEEKSLISDGQAANPNQCFILILMISLDFHDLKIFH